MQAAQAAPGDPNAHYALAEAYFRAGDLTNALASLRAAEARSVDPAFRQNVATKARAIEAMLMEQGAAPAAPTPAPVLRAADPAPIPAPVAPPVAAPGPPSDFDAAAEALQAGDLDRAHILALTGLQKDPRSARGNYLLAEVLAGKKDLEGARKAYSDALNGTNLPPARKDEIQRKLLRLEVAMEPGLDGSAAADAPVRSADSQALPRAQVPAAASTAASETDGSAYRSPLNAAATQAASGNLPGAIDELRHHLAANPSDTQARVALARYLLNSGDDVSALNELGQAINAAPANEAARTLRISILMARGEYGAALADLDAIVVAGRATATTYVNRGVANQRAGEATLALQDYDKAIAIEPSNTGIYVNKASALMELRQDQAAIDTLSIAIARDGNAVNALLYRGMAYFNRGSFAAAAEDFARVLVLDPGNSQALKYREQSLNAANERAKTQRPPSAP